MIGVRAERGSVHVCFLLLGLFRCSSIFLCLPSAGGESSLLDCWVLFCFVILYFRCSRLYVCYTYAKTRLKLRDFSKNPETSKFVHFAELKKSVITFNLNFFQISGIFPISFLPANTTNKKSLNYINFAMPFLYNIQSLETCSFRDRDSQKWVSRPHHCKLQFTKLFSSAVVLTWVPLGSVREEFFIRGRKRCGEKS